MTQSELKVAGRIGAELGAAKAENDRLRQALKAIDRRNDSPARFDQEIDKIVRTALSQQAEPVEPAPAQDERGVLLAEARMVIDACLQEVDLPSELAWMAERASKGRRIYVDERAVAIRPAQTAPQPEQSGLVEPTVAMVQAACAAFRIDVSPMEAMTEALRAALSAQGGSDE